MNWLGELVQRYVNPDDVVLDVGCGIHHTVEGLICKSYLGCDIWMKYLDQVKSKQPTVLMDVSRDLPRFPNKSFDVVLCLDVLEHLELDDAEHVLAQIKRIARKYAIVFTPSSFTSNESAAKNAWDLGECDFQYHKCVLTNDILAKYGYTVNTNNSDLAFFGVWDGNSV